jgi:hypothetical protein
MSRLRAHHFRQRGNQRSGIVSYNIRFNDTKKLFIESDLPAIETTSNFRGACLSSYRLLLITLKTLLVSTINYPEIVLTNDWLADFDNIEATLDRILPFLRELFSGY